VDQSLGLGAGSRAVGGHHPHQRQGKQVRSKKLDSLIAVWTALKALSIACRAFSMPRVPCETPQSKPLQLFHSCHMPSDYIPAQEGTVTMIGKNRFAGTKVDAVKPHLSSGLSQATVDTEARKNRPLADLLRAGMGPKVPVNRSQT